MADVMAESDYTEEQVFDCGISGEIVFLVVVPLVGACRVPIDALSHFMAGADDYTADGMAEHYSGALSGPWQIKRDRLRLLPESWEIFSKKCHELANALDLANPSPAESTHQPQAAQAQEAPTPAPVVTDQTPLPVFTVQARPLFVPPELESMSANAQILLIDRVGGVNTDSTPTVEDHLEEIRATISRQAEGYFTINEASQILSDATGSPVKTQLKKLLRAIHEKEIRALDQDDKNTVAGEVQNHASVLRESDMIAAGFAFPNAPQPAPVMTGQAGGDGIDFAVLACPAELIAAFGRFTGMNASWFDKWADYPVLKNAIKVKGTSGRGRTTEPLFCPFLVMQGLMKKPRKSSNRRAFQSTEKPWELLKQHFANVYATHQGLSPLDD